MRVNITLPILVAGCGDGNLKAGDRYTLRNIKRGNLETDVLSPSLVSTLACRHPGPSILEVKWQ